MIEYEDVTDCPTCPMLATDRDDALVEARELTADVELLEATLRSVMLYVDWRYVTKQLTTEQRERWFVALNDGADEPLGDEWRWWDAPPEPMPQWFVDAMTHPVTGAVLTTNEEFAEADAVRARLAAFDLAHTGYCGCGCFQCHAHGPHDLDGRCRCPLHAVDNDTSSSA